MKTILLLITIFVITSFTRAQLKTLSAADKQAIVDGINQWRSKVVPQASNMQTITWSNDIERFSQKWVSTCVYGHSTQADKNSVVPPVNGVPVLSGENLAWRGTTSAITATPLQSVFDAQKMWRDEAVDYNYNSGSCNPGKVCGHYVMEAWASATKIGCAVAHCKPFKIGGTWSSTYNYYSVVCNYDKIPYTGQKPYVAGTPSVTRPPVTTTQVPTKPPVTTKPPTTTTRPPTTTTRPPTTRVPTTRPPTSTTKPAILPTSTGLSSNVLLVLNTVRKAKGQSELISDSLLTSAISNKLSGGSFDFAVTNTKFANTRWFTFYPRAEVTASDLLSTAENASFRSQSLNNGIAYTHVGVRCVDYNASFKYCGVALGQAKPNVLEEETLLED